MTSIYQGYLQKRILIPLAVVIATTIAVFVSIVAWHINDGISHDARLQTHIATTVYQSDIESDVDMIVPIMEMIQGDDQIREAFAQRDREALLRLTAPLYEHLNKDHHITHFYFINPDRINLLRVHNSHRFGDRIDRQTTLEAEQSGKLSYGLELGVVGTFTLRVVMPWYHQGELLGYLELGEEIDHIVTKLRELLNLDIYVFIRKSLLDAGKISELTETMGRSFSWERYPDYLMVSAPRIEATMPPLLDRILHSEHDIIFNQQIDVTIPAAHYKATFLPLQDINKAQVGMLLLLDSTERWYQAGFKTISLSILLLIIVGGAVFLFFFRLARTTERTLEDNQQQLLVEHTRIKESNRILIETEEHLRLSRDRLSEAQRIAHLGSWEWDIVHNKLYWSAEVYRIFGLPESNEPLSYKTFLNTIPEQQRDTVERAMQQARGKGDIYALEHAIIRPDRSTRIVQERGEVFIKDGKAVRIVGTTQDITEQRIAEEKMEQLGQIFDNASNEIYLIDVKTLTILQANHTAATRLDYSGKELSRLNYLEVATELTSNRLRTLVAPLHDGARKEIDFASVHRRKCGDNYPVEVRLQLAEMNNQAIYIAIVLDISERVAQQHALHHREMHDPLTELPNRFHLLTLLGQEVARTKRDSGSLVLAQFNINGFGEINDTLGHDNGDLILQQFAQRLRASSRETDTVARVGGDEFTLLLPGATMSDCDKVMENIMQSLNKPFSTDAFSLMIECSVGIAVFPEHATNAKELLQHSDIALKRAKKFGSGIEIYHPELDPSSVRHLILSSHLRNAIEKGELHLYYQPKVDSKSGQVTEAEALIRWLHPEHGMISPVEFIPIAERTGYIKQLTLWIIREAAQQQARWQTMGITLRVGVNLSARNLLDPDLLIHIIHQVQESGIEHDCLSFEVTESAAMRDPDYTITVLNELSSLGHRIAIDDYGTGYSSLAYLQRLPIDELKIDSSFIFRMLQDEDSAIIVRSTIALGHNLGKSITAEGVESAALAAVLTELECDLLQGYYFSKPVAANEFTSWLRVRSDQEAP
jgi:diguanylate cyclase (GGDEF)-like protein/PAS domain S-box-containing protein